ncbi:GtrA-like protein [Phenylobacterium zucineum HLK1]|uniref:GtrA-like protein n=1 Tax=Phenylobacterium zucineum (strain HLK1) TaxID=450851 RepID=B4RCJ9_PHEZH|nr:GtrA family protein [Phenylobacterium zucineum]ACG76598.1 GtrA-like protein [Phenylobacterium zucineum HLK1]
MSARILARQGVLFAIFGVIATGVHVTVALAAHHLAGASPLVANFLGYACAVGVSYFGNARVTFGRDALHGGQFARFLTVSLAGLALNQGITHLVADRLGQPFWLALAITVLTVPPATFVASRLWAFRHRG